MKYSPDPKLLCVQSGLQFNIITRTANLDIQIFWDVTSWRTEGANLLHLQGEALPVLLTDPEEEGTKILRNVGDYLPVDTV